MEENYFSIKWTDNLVDEIILAYNRPGDSKALIKEQPKKDYLFKPLYYLIISTMLGFSLIVLVKSVKKKIESDSKKSSLVVIDTSDKFTSNFQAGFFQTIEST